MGDFSTHDLIAVAGVWLMFGLGFYLGRHSIRGEVRRLRELVQKLKAGTASLEEALEKQSQTKEKD